MVIMRRFKTNSASSSTSSSRKSSSVSGLFKSASSPTPPCNFNASASTETAPPASSSGTSGPSGFFSYGRVMRSLHSSIGYMSGHSSSSNDANENVDNANTEDPNLLSVDAGIEALSLSGNVPTCKSPLSPKLPSRFKFSKNKAKSNSGSWYSVGKSCEEVKTGASCPGLLETTSYSLPASKPTVPLAKETTDSKFEMTLAAGKSSKAKSTNSSGLKSGKHSRPILMRQHSDEHQNALLEKVLQESSKSHTKKDKASKKGPPLAVSASRNGSNSKNSGKLRKMVALECPVPNDIVYEEGDSNKCIDNVHFNDLFHGTLNDSSSVTMPHSIRNDPRLFKDDVDIRFSRTLNSCKLPQIRYASPDRLFERLTDLRFLSIDFLNTFLLTYRVFTDSITVIEALKRVHYNPDLQLNAMSSSLHDSSGSLEEGQTPGPRHESGGGQSASHLHPHQSPHHGNLLNLHANAAASSGPAAGVAAANEYLSTTIDYDYSRRVSTSSVLSDINELGVHRESIVSNTDSQAGQQLNQAQQLFTSSNTMVRNSQHWRLSYRKFEEEQARDRYIKRMSNRNAHGSISSTSSSTAQELNSFNLPAGEPMLAPAITDPITVPMPPPPSPEVPAYFQKEMKGSAAFDKNDSGSSNEEGSPVSPEQPSVKATENLQVPAHSQSMDTLTEHGSMSSATSSATLVGSDSKSGSPRPSPVRKSPPQKLPSNDLAAPNGTEKNAILEENEEVPDQKAKAHSRQTPPTPLQNQLSEGTPPPTPPLPGTPKHPNQAAAGPLQTPPLISSVGSCFVLPPKNQPQSGPSQKSDSRSSSISQPVAASGRLSATSTTLAMNYLRVRGAGSKRGSAGSEAQSECLTGSTSVTPRSSFQTDTTGISTPRSSFQHPDSPQMSSKAGVVVTSSRATSRRSSTASAASAFAVATAASSNPPERMDPMMQIPSRGNSRFSSAAGADLKIPNANLSGQGGPPSAATVAANAARCKRESMISTAATMRVLNVLRHWVSKHSQDFENDERLLKITTEFLDELVHNTNLLPAEHKAAVQLQQMIAKQTMEAKEKVDLDVLLAPPMNPSKDTIESLSALEIAEVMTYIDHNIFVRIQSEEFLGQAWMKEDKNTKAFHILLMTKHFNDISRLVASEVLRVPEIPKRVAVIEKWAAVADICRCLHNFNGVLQICAAFTNSSVFRLKRTWEKVTKTTKQTIDKLQTLVSTDGRFRNMREALHRCDPPCIPYLGMYLTDLSFIEEGTPNFTDDGLLNFSKMRMIAHVIREIRHFQQTPYKIEHNPRVTNYLLDNSRHLHDEQLYQKSLCMEPRLSRISRITPLRPTETSPSTTGATFAATSGPLAGSTTTPSHSQPQ